MNSLLRNRTVKNLGLNTPLLVPSFSSRGCPDLRNQYNRLAPYLDCCLVSAYDLGNGLLSLAEDAMPRLLFIDSGGYETKEVCAQNLSDDANSESVQRRWTTSRLQTTVSNVPPVEALVVVNLELEGPATISDQLAAGADYFYQSPHAAAKDFLLKPDDRCSSHVEADALLPFLPAIMSFADILGITDKELGSTMQQRCTNLIGLRRALDAVCSGFPIHVFGALDPLTVCIYALCGADVFDGLSWLRFDFAEGATRHIAQSMFEETYWELAESDVQLAIARSNIRFLNRLQAELRQAATDGNTLPLKSMANMAKNIDVISERIGMTIV